MPENDKRKQATKQGHTFLMQMYQELSVCFLLSFSVLSSVEVMMLSAAGKSFSLGTCIAGIDRYFNAILHKLRKFFFPVLSEKQKRPLLVEWLAHEGTSVVFLVQGFVRAFVVTMQLFCLSVSYCCCSLFHEQDRHSLALHNSVLKQASSSSLLPNSRSLAS